MKVAYPVIFTETKDNILIEVPDLKIYTEANGAEEEKGPMADAIMMARDAFGLHCITAVDNKASLEEPSAVSDIEVEKGVFAEEGKGFVSLVDVDLVSYRRAIENKSVRRNVTLPYWLNAEAEAAHINVSKVLQEALMSVLEVSR